MKYKWAIFILAILGVTYPVVEATRHILSNANLTTFPDLKYGFYTEVIFVIAGYMLTVWCAYLLTRRENE